MACVFYYCINNYNLVNNGDFYVDDVVNYPNIRTFMAGLETSDEPLYDLISIARNWEEPTPGMQICRNWVPWHTVCTMSNPTHNMQIK